MQKGERVISIFNIKIYLVKNNSRIVDIFESKQVKLSIELTNFGLRKAAEQWQLV